MEGKFEEEEKKEQIKYKKLGFILSRMG